MDRRAFLRRAGIATAGSTLVAGPATAQSEPEPEENNTPVDGTTAYVSKIQTIRSPLAGVPAIQADETTLRVELDPDAMPAGEEVSVEATLRPSFGAAAVGVGLGEAQVGSQTESAIWNAAEGEDDQVRVATFTIPSIGATDAFTPDLYDLEVSWTGPNGLPRSDTQPRAVRVYADRVPDDLDVVVIGDPQIGDPRAAQTGADESRNDGSPEPFVDHTTKLTGDSGTDRWEATRRAIEELNATDPDVVLVAGDLTFGQDAPGKYYQEYEDAWEIVNELRAPCFCTLGNHDGYVQSGIDGKALYRETFGPPSYAVDVGAHRIVAVDTYDWNYLDRMSLGLAVSSYGGQVRDPQFTWLEDALHTSQSSIVAFGHHNPSWQPDPENRFRDQAEGTPLVEQIARGQRYASSGQLWTGVNQFAIRELFDERGVDVFFAGHSHRDRIARSIPAAGDGVADIAETHGPRTGSPGFHYVEYAKTGSNDQPGEYSEYEVTVDPDDRDRDSLKAMLTGTGGQSGTLYVNCTTTQSGTGQYWGWRPLAIDAKTDGLDPTTFGYPWPDEESLDERAVNPENWAVEDGAVGLYSHPSYLLDVERSDEGPAASAQEQVQGPPTEASVTLTNGLNTDIDGATILSVAQCDAVTVTNGDLLWVRSGDDATDVKIGYIVDPKSKQNVTVSCN